MSTVFCGRQDEMKQLREAFESCAQRTADGKFAGPKMLFLVAESGIGKSRLVQELYFGLTQDAAWDPHHYWPDDFRETGQQLRVVPDMAGHKPDGSPCFAWLGARWQQTDTRNVQDRLSVLPELQTSIMAHATILEQYGSAWSAAGKRLLNSIKSESHDVFIEELAGQILPFAGVLLKLVKGTTKLIDDRRSGHQSFEEKTNEIIKTEAEELIENMSLLLDGRGAIPTVMWLDDAQWIDPYTLDFLHRLWPIASDRHWPLLVIVTHWERQWREMTARLAAGQTQHELNNFIGKPGVSEMLLSKASDAALAEYLQHCLPGISTTQSALLIEKAGGNYLTMTENIGELQAEPMWFVNENIANRLTEAALNHIKTFESERHRRVAQRFKQLDPETRKILGWSTQIGVRFLEDVVASYAREKHPDLDAKDLIERCVDPYVILGKPSALICEFRDKIFHQVAAQYKDKFLAGDAEKIMELFRMHLSDWINNSFDSEGCVVQPDPDPLGKKPERSLAALDPQETSHIVEHARHILPLASEADWDCPRQKASLRALILSIAFYDQTYQMNLVVACCRSLRQVDWHNVPNSVVSESSRIHLLNAGIRAGAYNSMKPLSDQMLTRHREVAGKLDSYASWFDVISSLDSAAQIELGRDERDAALQRYTESLQVRYHLAKNLGTPESWREVCLGLSIIAYHERKWNAVDAAVGRYAECLEIYRSLDSKLNTPRSRLDVCQTLDNMAETERDRGKLDAARQHYTEGVQIRRRLAEELETVASWHDVCVSLHSLALIDCSQRWLDDALQKYAECLQIGQRLAHTSGTPESWHGVMSSLNMMAAIEYDRGNIDAALEKYTECLRAGRILTDMVDTPRNQQHLIDCLDKIARIEYDRGNFDAALHKYTESLERYRALSESASSLPALQYVCLRLHDAARIFYNLGALEHAFEKHRECLHIHRRITNQAITSENLGKDGERPDSVAQMKQEWNELAATLGTYSKACERRQRLREALTLPFPMPPHAYD